MVDALARLGDPRAIEPLLELAGEGGPHFTPSDGPVAALAVLGETGAVAAFRRAMAGKHASERRSALWSLARLETDATDRSLLSADRFDGKSPGIDPRAAISPQAVSKRAAGLDLPEDDIRARYERLARRYPLKLAWQPRPPRGKKS